MILCDFVLLEIIGRLAMRRTSIVLHCYLARCVLIVDRLQLCENAKTVGNSKLRKKAATDLLEQWRSWEQTSEFRPFSEHQIVYPGA